MALSATLTQYPSGQERYAIPFPYLARQFVVVTLIKSSDITANKVLTVGNDYRFLNATTIEILASQDGYDILEVSRWTSSEPLVDFVDGSVLTSSDLTVSEMQAIHIAEEGRDQVLQATIDYVDIAHKYADDAEAALDDIRKAGMYGYVPMGTFELGGTVSQFNEVLSIGTGDSRLFYRWDNSLPKTVPPASTPEGTGGIGAGKWIDVTDATLRGNLAKTDGAKLVGFKGTTVYDKLSKTVGAEYYLEDMGVPSDGTPCVVQLQAAINKVAAAGGGILKAKAGGVYLVNGPVYICSDIHLDGQFATMKGLGPSYTGLTTGFLDTDGVVKSNLDAGTSDPEYRCVRNCTVYNWKFMDLPRVAKLFKFYNNCGFMNNVVTNCGQYIQGEWVFYSEYSQSMVTGATLGVPALEFLGQNNAIKIHRMTTTCDYCYRFTGGTTAVSFTECTAEGGSRVFNMEGDVMGVTWDGIYAEAITGKLFDFSLTTTGYLRFSNNYINYVDIVFQDSTSGTLFGSWDESNTLVNVGNTAGSFLYRGLMNVAGGLCYVDFKSRPDIDNVVPDLPTNWQTSPSSSVRRIQPLQATGVGDVFSKSVIQSGIIERHHSGSVGRGVVGLIPMCTHNAFQPGNESVIIIIHTKIAISTKCFTKFNFDVLRAGAANFSVAGDTYGSLVKRADGNTTVPVSMENENGYIRLLIGPFSSTNGVYDISGGIQIV